MRKLGHNRYFATIFHGISIEQYKTNFFKILNEKVILIILITLHNINNVIPMRNTTAAESSSKHYKNGVIHINSE